MFVKYAHRAVGATTIAALCLSCVGLSTAHASTARSIPNSTASQSAATVSATVIKSSSDASTVSSTLSGTVVPVVDAQGVISGYRVDDATRAQLDLLVQRYSTELAHKKLSDLRATTPEEWDWVRIGKCSVGIIGFIALTVFPTARLAALAARLGGMVTKYGVEKVAKVLLRMMPAMEPSMKDILAEISGVSMLGPCWS